MQGERECELENGVQGQVSESVFIEMTSSGCMYFRKSRLTRTGN